MQTEKFVSPSPASPHRPVLVALCSLLLAACAGGPGEREGGEFETLMGEDGTPRFNFRIAIDIPEPRTRRPEGYRDQRRQPAGPGPDGMADPYLVAEQLRPRVFDSLHRALEETGYCPGGYRVLTSSFGASSLVVGECLTDS